MVQTNIVVPDEKIISEETIKNRIEQEEIQEVKKLLVVDDDLDYLGTLAFILEKQFEIYTATGVKEALQFLDNKKVDAICSDFNMCDGTGLDILEDIRKSGIVIPFLLMSYSDDYLLERKVKLYDGVFCCKTDNDLIARITTLVEYGK